MYMLIYLYTWGSACGGGWQQLYALIHAHSIYHAFSHISLLYLFILLYVRERGRNITCIKHVSKYALSLEIYIYGGVGGVCMCICVCV